MFRTQNNVPKVYVEQSRDFQLFCRLLDLTVDSVKYDIAHMTDSLTPRFVNNRFLILLAHRVGFFTNKPIDDNVLRYIISTFSYAVRNKGSIIGIKTAIVAVLRAENNDSEPTVMIDNATHTILIYTEDAIINTVALNEYLKYIIPSGFEVKYLTAKSLDSIKTELDVYSSATIVKLSEYGTAKIRKSDDEYNQYGVIANNTIGAFDTAVIPKTTVDGDISTYNSNPVILITSDTENITLGKDTTITIVAEGLQSQENIQWYRTWSDSSIGELDITSATTPITTITGTPAKRGTYKLLLRVTATNVDTSKTFEITVH